MGLQATLKKEYNYLYTDFEDAYWKVTDVGMGIMDGVYGVQYMLTAYPSQEAKEKSESRAICQQLEIGGSAHFNYEAELYRFIDFVPFNRMFSDGVAPTNADALKTAVYNYIKSSHPALNFGDVLEDGQTV